MIQKPYDINIKDKVIDGNNSYLLKWKTSGDVSASFSINIYNNSNNNLTWSLPRAYSFALSYTIPAEVIPNGHDYKIAITVWNATDQSATSQFVVFTASSVPVVSVDPIGTIGNHSYLFSATYEQSENVPLSFYRANLYNSEQKLIKTSGINTDGLLEYRFDLLKNEATYYIEFIVTSKKGLTSSSGLVEVSVAYTNPSMYFDLSAESVEEKAGVKLKWKIKQVTGKTNIAPVYINGEELDIRGGKVWYDEGFEISSNFTLKIWLRSLLLNEDLISLNGSNGNIRVQYKNDNCFHLYKTVNGFNYHYSFPINIGNNGHFITPFQYVEGETGSVFLCIQQINGKIEIQSEVVN